MRRLLISLLTLCNYVHADTIKSYMGIANNIPQMEVKADPEAQAWARSARHVITITCESIGETIMQANEIASKHGNPIFCLPTGTQLDPAKWNDLIQQTYKDLSSQQSDKDSMTVSQIAWIGITKQYPCNANTAAKTEMNQINAAWGGASQGAAAQALAGR